MDYRDNILSNLKAGWKTELEQSYSIQEASQLLNRLIQHFVGISRVDQSLHPGYRLSESELIRLNNAVKRLLNEEPLQYITGVTDFYGLNLRVNPSVLIPRPETEELVDLILHEKNKKQINILDIGTGSGCIALALKKNLPESKVVAIDISKAALSLARSNATENHLEVQFYTCNILNFPTCPSGENFDIIVSNPPYVTQTDKKLMKKNVLGFEPHLALFVDDHDPLLFYRHIADFARLRLKKQGKLYVEINENYGAETVRLFGYHGLTKISMHTDIEGKNRFISAVKEDI